MIPPYPLAWPEGLPRSEAKFTSQFRTSLSAALENVRKSLTAFGADTGKKATDVVITSNVAGISFDPPTDKGVAVWFEWEAVNGPLPKGHALKCLDGNKLNCDPSNWEAIPRALLPRLNGGRFGNSLQFDQAAPELKSLVMANAKLKHIAREKRRAAGNGGAA